VSIPVTELTDFYSSLKKLAALMALPDSVH